MNPTSTPTGDERGTYLSLDMGGSHIRVSEVVLEGKGQASVNPREFNLPDELKSGTSQELWDHMAGCVLEFNEQERPEKNKEEAQHLAFTFSFPVTQTAINRGVLQRWTKGF